MTNTTDTQLQPGQPAIHRRRWGISLIWIVPIVAAAIGISMLVHAWLSEGPEITILFRTATGLEAGKTPVKYKDVTVGAVTAITLSEDGSHVKVKVALMQSAKSLTSKDSRFWVVRPRIGASGISGVDTLLSGAYIGVDKGQAEETASEFTGLEMPPPVVGDMPGKSFILKSEDLGSLDIGSPVYYRRIQVGRVASYQLGETGQDIKLQIFIDAPYDRYVTTDTRFWNASGVDVSLGADGLKLKTQSVATIVAGGVAFASPMGSQASPADKDTEFTLTADQDTAMAPPDGQAQYIQLKFDQSLRGLSVGAPVQFSGVDLGRVVSINLDYDPVKHRFPTVVGVLVYPERMGRVLEKLPKLEGDNDRQAALFMHSMVKQGLRAQARLGNILTGQLYIAMDFVPNAPKVELDVNARPISMPTVNGSFDRMQEQIANIVTKIEKMPLDSIAKHLDASLVNLDKTLTQVNTHVLPETTQTLQQTRQTMQDAGQTMQQARQTLSGVDNVLADDAPLSQNLGQTLQEVQRTSRSLRELTDLLGRHPESLLRGRPADPALKSKPVAPSPQEESKP
ncbi:PqiB family protein [Methylovorus glucosotrophus]|uniref:Mammalian cell entry related domain protein n=1 Tax=Methylovorus glucosotrophus (strain SIP3-4) TaxID=582744 RepID=C6X771_METGS|nr:MlaD family protein [Methylovorus glucosotrophus]ACT51214.1 Mammalian cell entry related domain protein [Methylovorus glucosotrophus SIP3-4]